jgi:serine/threonine-protein kinase
MHRQATDVPQIVGRYAIYGRFASGGMASVHFGRLLGAAGFSRTVAIKRLHAHLADDSQFLSAMIDEARLAARIRHPNVVPTLDVVAADGELLLVMEYIHGESLAQLLRHGRERNRRVPLPIVSAIVIGALHGLHAAHEATDERGAPLGIVHRDVSPQNILVGVDGAARVIDFGIAKAAGRLQTTGAGGFKGKIPYMAPERVRVGSPQGKELLTRAADIYAMGVVLWEMLAGKRLFLGGNDAELVVQVRRGVQDPPGRHAPGLPALLDALVMRAVAADPADRFPSARHMAEGLRRAVSPALPTEVGTWLEDVASEALTRRKAALYDIECTTERVPMSMPDETVVWPIRSPDGSPSAESMGTDVRTALTEISNLSLSAPEHLPAYSRPSRRAMLAGAFLGAFLIAACLATFYWWPRETLGAAAIAPAPVVASEGGNASVPASTSAVPPSPAAPSEEPPADPPLLSPPAQPPRVIGGVIRPQPSAAAIPVSSAPVARPRPHPRAHPLPQPSTPFRFSEPD